MQPPTKTPVGKGIQIVAAPSTFQPPDPGSGEIKFESDDSALSVPANIPLNGAAFFVYVKTIPWWRYQAVDYFRAAVELFVTAAQNDFADQKKSASADGKEITNFTWKNGGGLAENFAAALDQTQNLFEAVSRNPDLKKRLGSTTFGDFAKAAMAFMRSETRIPLLILNEKRYATKFRDWEIGGTRYSLGDAENQKAIKTNVKFADAAQRRNKIRGFLASKLNTNGAGAKSAFELAMESSSTRVNISDGTALIGRPAFIPTIRIHRRPTAAAVVPQAGKPSEDKTVPQLPSMVPKTLSEDERQNQDVRCSLHRLLGTAMSIPDTMKSSVLPPFIVLCQTARFPAMRLKLIDIIHKSSVPVQSSFDRRGGMKVVLTYLVDWIQSNNQYFVLKGIEYLAAFQGMIQRDTVNLWCRHPFDESKNSPQEVAKRLQADGNQIPPLLPWIREYLKRPAAEGTQSLDMPYAHNCLTRFETKLWNAFTKRPLDAILPSARIGPRPESNGVPATLSAKLSRPTESDEVQRELTQTVLLRARARHSGDVLRLDGNGPIITGERGDTSESAPPSAIVECFCIRCVKPGAVNMSFDPYALLGVDRPRPVLVR